MNLKKIQITKKSKSKKALSEMVSYILLVVIALGLSVSVFAWLKSQLPSEKEEKCSEDVALAIRNYACNPLTEEINLTLENTGLFNIKGVYVRGANETGRITTIMMNSSVFLGGGTTPALEGTLEAIPGKYDFPPETFKIGTQRNIVMSYDFTTGVDKLERIQLQPFVNGTDNRILLCDNLIDLNLAGC